MTSRMRLTRTCLLIPLIPYLTLLRDTLPSTLPDTLRDTLPNTLPDSLPDFLPNTLPDTAA